VLLDHVGEGDLVEVVAAAGAALEQEGAVVGATITTLGARRLPAASGLTRCTTPVP